MILKGIKKYFRERSFMRDKDLVTRSKKVVNFSEAKSISIIYDASNEKEHHNVLNFGRKLQLQGKSVRALGYVGYKIIPHYCNPTLTWDFFTLKEINWFGRPDSVHIRDFLKVDTDILIYLDQNNNESLHYIAGISRAKFKSGLFNEEHSDTFDLMIQLQEKVDVNVLIEQIVTYLTMINKKNNEPEQ